MTNITNFIRLICLNLQRNPEFSTFRFITAFPGGTKATPLRAITVAVSLDSMREQNVQPVYETVAEGSGQTPELLYNHTMDMRVRLEIHVPQSRSGVDCYSVFVRLAQYLMGSDFLPYAIHGVGCGDVKYDRDMGAFVLHAYADVSETSIVS